MKQSFEVKAKTQLGQHFLADGRVIAQLIHAINPKRGEWLLNDPRALKSPASTALQPLLAPPAGPLREKPL